MSIQLPTTRRDPKRVNPKRLVIYSPFKAGKTTLVSKLDNCLLIELEPGGADYVSSMVLEANSLKELGEIGRAIAAANYPYEYVAIDTVTKLEELCEPLATANYKRSPLGVNFTGNSVLTLANGAGYHWLREAFMQWMNYCYTLAPNIILLGHLKDKFLGNDASRDVSAKDLDLTGKIKSMVCANADAIGYLSRKNGQMILNFNTTEEITCGSRCDHLKGKEIVIADVIPDTDPIQINAHWERVYLPI